MIPSTAICSSPSPLNHLNHSEMTSVSMTTKQDAACQSRQDSQS